MPNNKQEIQLNLTSDRSRVVSYSLKNGTVYKTGVSLDNLLKGRLFECVAKVPPYSRVKLTSVLSGSLYTDVITFSIEDLKSLSENLAEVRRDIEFVISLEQ